MVQYSLEKKQKDNKFRLFGLNMHKLYTLLKYQNDFSMKTRPLSGMWETIKTKYQKVLPVSHMSVYGNTKILLKPTTEQKKWSDHRPDESAWFDDSVTDFFILRIWH